MKKLLFGIATMGCVISHSINAQTTTIQRTAEWKQHPNVGAEEYETLVIGHNVSTDKIVQLGKAVPGVTVSPIKLTAGKWKIWVINQVGGIKSAPSNVVEITVPFPAIELIITTRTLVEEDLEPHDPQ